MVKQKAVTTNMQLLQYVQSLSDHAVVGRGRLMLKTIRGRLKSTRVTASQDCVKSSQVV